MCVRRISINLAQADRCTLHVWLAAHMSGSTLLSVEAHENRRKPKSAVKPEKTVHVIPLFAAFGRMNIRPAIYVSWTLCGDELLRCHVRPVGAALSVRQQDPLQIDDPFGGDAARMRASNEKDPQ